MNSGSVFVAEKMEGGIAGQEKDTLTAPPAALSTETIGSPVLKGYVLRIKEEMVREIIETCDTMFRIATKFKGRCLPVTGSSWSLTQESGLIERYGDPSITSDTSQGSYQSRGPGVVEQELSTIWSRLICRHLLTGASIPESCLAYSSLYNIAKEYFSYICVDDHHLAQSHGWIHVTSCVSL